MEIKLHQDFNDPEAVLDYFSITPKLAERVVKDGKSGWLRVKETIAMRMSADPRFNGMVLRDSQPVLDISYWLQKRT